MITDKTTLGELLYIAKRLDPEHGALQGITIYPSGMGCVVYRLRAFHLDLKTIPTSAAQPRTVPAQPSKL